MLKTEIQISDYIHPLDKFGKIGQIHSVFEHSFNLVVNQQLINVANYQEYPSCFGFYLPEKLFRQVQPFAKLGNRVKLSENSLTFYSGEGVYKLSLVPHQIVSLKVAPPITVNYQTLCALKKILAEQDLLSKVGIEQTAEFNNFCQALLTPERVEWEVLTTWFVGRGKGLTPSGDDILVAYLFVLTLYGQKAAKPFAEALSKHRFGTTDISRAYLETCIKGYVNSLIFDLYQVIKNNQIEQLEPAVKQIMQIGHTSGKDLSFGIYLGVSAIINNMEKEH